MKRLATGVPELDLVLGGGILPGSLVVFAGGPGTGKTILAQQICFATATPERKAIYYTTLAEPHSKLVSYLESFAFFDADALEERVEFIHLGDLLLEESGSDGQPLGPIIDEIVRTSFERRPVVIVIDSAKALRDFVDEGALRKVIYDLAGKVAHTKTVILFLGEYSPEELGSSPEFSLADGIVEFAYEPREPVDRRWLRVRKLRGSAHLGGKHSFTIGEPGITVHPRLETIPRMALAQAAVGERIASGIPRLDELMGGGIHAGEATAIVGPSGTGKTAAALHFVVQGLAEGERCLLVSFQESVPQLVEKAASFGWDLDDALESGRLTIQHVPSEELDLDRIGAAMRRELAAGEIRRVAVDSLGELVFAARELERFPAYARALAGFIRAGGASALITSETSTLAAVVEPLAGLSFLFHNIVLLRYIEIESEVRRSISVLKMRGSDHAKGLWQFEVGEGGIAVGEQLTGLTGVLGWSALRGDPSGNGSSGSAR
ncbi:MAG: AAA family ATPase [Actinobacteria bacterium]|nr:AAA family ATPase [Actinomycetota bacterium]